MDKVSQLIKFLNHSTNITPEVLESFLSRLNLTKTDIAPWISEDLTACQASKQIIHQDKHFELLAISWHKNELSSIHVHDQAEWGSILVFGSARYAVFKIETDLTVTTLEERELQDNDVVNITPSTMHQLGTLNDEPFYSLHIYGSTTQCDNISGQAKNYVLREDKLVYLSEGGFL